MEQTKQTEKFRKIRKTKDLLRRIVCAVRRKAPIEEGCRKDLVAKQEKIAQAADAEEDGYYLPGCS